MRRLGVLVLMTCLLATSAQSAQLTSSPLPRAADFLEGVRTAIEKNLGRPYVWGASGLKSFDCSGFIWRVMYDNGVLVKRTTARKFYMMLKPVSKEDQWNFGTLVFFDDLKHVGIVDTPKAFFHAQTSVGTNRSEMNAFWRNKIYGFRRLPVPGNAD